MVAGTSSFTCALTTCDSGYSDCSAMQAGCETQLGTMTDCRVVRRLLHECPRHDDAATP